MRASNDESRAGRKHSIHGSARRCGGGGGYDGTVSAASLGPRVTMTLAPAPRQNDGAADVGSSGDGQEMWNMVASLLGSET